jgi:hypothetical protein
VRTIDTGAEQRKGLLCHSLSSVAVSPDSRRAALSPTDRKGILLSLPDGAWLRELEPHNAFWTFSPDSARLLDSQSGAIFAAADGQPVGQCGEGRGMAQWSPDGRTILRCDATGASLCAPDGARRHVITDGGAGGGRGVFSPDGTRAAVVLDTSAFLVDGESGARIGPPFATGQSMFARFVSPTRLLLWPMNASISRCDDPVRPRAASRSAATSSSERSRSTCAGSSSRSPRTVSSGSGEETREPRHSVARTSPLAWRRRAPSPGTLLVTHL